MRFDLKKMALFAAWTIFAEGSAYPQDAIDKLQPLVGTSAQRLGIAEQVALAKWDSKTPVEDASREDQVIVGAAKAGQSRGLDPTSVSNFFRAQIEASTKLLSLRRYVLGGHRRYPCERVSHSA